MSKLQTTPSGWKLTTLGTFMEFKNGVNADKNAYGSGTEFVNVMDIFKRNFMKKCNILGKVEITEKQKAEYSVKYGDILFNRTSEVPDEIAFSSVYLDEAEITFGGFVIRGRQKKELLDPLFAGYCFNNSSIRREMIRRSQGVVRANIGQKDLNKVPILIPPKDEQKKIASVLALWDNAIEKTEALIAAKEKQFEWLISELISKPNDEKKENWRQVKLGDIGEISSAGVDKKIIKGEIPVRLINYLDVYRSDFIVSKNITHQVTATAAKASKCATQKGDIFFTPSSELRGDIGHSSVATEDMPDAVYSYHVVRLRLHENWDLKYRAYAFKARNFFKQAYKYADGSGQRYVISQNNFRKMEICVPPLETQQKISNILYEAQKEIHLLKKTLEQYHSQKRGLMQKLLTGEWQVSSSQHLSEETYQELSREGVA